MLDRDSDPNLSIVFIKEEMKRREEEKQKYEEYSRL
jgi:hypothetical protein